MAVLLAFVRDGFGVFGIGVSGRLGGRIVLVGLGDDLVRVVIVCVCAYLLLLKLVH